MHPDTTELSKKKAMMTAENNNTLKRPPSESYVCDILFEKCLLLREDAHRLGIRSARDLRSMFLIPVDEDDDVRRRGRRRDVSAAVTVPPGVEDVQSRRAAGASTRRGRRRRSADVAGTVRPRPSWVRAVRWVLLSWACWYLASYAWIGTWSPLDGAEAVVGGAWRTVLGSRCVLRNNFLVMEVSRPPADCAVCRGVDRALVLPANVTRQAFAPYAYASRPVLVRGAAAGWNATATGVFDFRFFRTLYEETEGAFESVEEDCQFFPFRTSFVTLRDVFSMSAERAEGRDTEKPWYIGWSNCHPQIAQVLRQHYSRPHFLPDDSESSAIDWIFMGWAGQGASVHLDYVQRPSWQSQISGKKTWRLFPTPECENVCGSFDIVVQKGDIVLIDTNQWYHDTFIHPGEISITIGSEYD